MLVSQGTSDTTAPPSFAEIARPSLGDQLELRGRRSLRALGRLRPFIWLGLGLAAAYVLLPQVPSLVASLRSLPPAQPMWVIAGVGLVGFRYAMAAVSLQVVVSRPIALRATLLVQFASAFIGRLTPEGVGWFVLNQRYLERSGIPRASALAAIGLKLLVGGLVRLLIALAVAAQLGSDTELFENPAGLALLAAVAGAFGILVIFLTTTVRGRWPEAWARAVGAAQDLRLVVRDWRRAAALIATTGALTVAYGLVLATSLAAFGVTIPMATVLAIYLGGTAVAAVSPTPGNLGALELVLTAGLTAVGVPASMALAAVILYRALTFWMPIVPGFLAFRYLQKQQLI